MAEPAGPSVLVVLSSNARRGAEIEGHRLSQELTDAGVSARAVALAPGSGEGARLDVPVLGARPLSWRTLRALRREARAVDVVLAYGSTTLPACALGLVGSRRPFVYRSIGDPAQWLRGRWHRERTGILMRRAAIVVPLWDEAAASIQQLYRLPASQIAVIPNARSVDEFRPPTSDERSAARKSFGVDDDEILAVVVGALSKEKRVDLAIRAVAELESVRLLVVGEGDCRTQLEKLGSEVLGERVAFTGTLTDVRPVYAAADVLVLPSRTEGMPGVVVEAGLMGVPAAACDVGAMRWLMKHGVSGTLVSVDAEPPELAAAITTALFASEPVQTLETSCSWAAAVAGWRQVIDKCAIRRSRDR